jgi:hypothetical protein
VGVTPSASSGRPTSAEEGALAELNPDDHEQEQLVELRDGLAQLGDGRLVCPRSYERGADVVEQGALGGQRLLLRVGEDGPEGHGRTSI